MSTLQFDAIIFDHDGTLIDTESPDFEACKMLCQELGLTLTLEYWAERIVGRMDGYDSFFEELAQASPNGDTPADLWERLKALWQVTFEDVQLMPGVTQLLPQLQAAGYSLGVATASDRAWANRWLGNFNLLPYFKVIATNNDITHNKPAPDVYLFAADQLGIKPERCLVFEDSVAGMESAKAAGMTVIAVPNHLTKTLDFSRADAIVNGLENVSVDWIETLRTA